MDTPLPIPNREVKHWHADNSLGKDKSSQTIFFCLKINVDKTIVVNKVYYSSKSLVTFVIILVAEYL